MKLLDWNNSLRRGDEEAWPEVEVLVVCSKTGSGKTGSQTDLPVERKCLLPLQKVSDLDGFKIRHRLRKQGMQLVALFPPRAEPALNSWHFYPRIVGFVSHVFMIFPFTVWFKILLCEHFLVLCLLIGIGGCLINFGHAFSMRHVLWQGRRVGVLGMAGFE